MDAAVKKIEVKGLSFEESFELFRQCVKEDVLNSHTEIPELAKTIAKGCKGLPLALITIGKAMSNRKKPREWRYAITALRSQPSEFIDVESHVGESDDYVKMHDVLCDMALWLASVKENKILVFENQESIRKRGMATWKETYVKTFPSSFFQYMHAMKVLDLSKNWYLTTLPVMSELGNLQYLNLSDTNIQELPIVTCGLTKLRFLLLDGTTFLKPYFRKSDIKSFIAPSVQQSTN
ncbi:hypothetical protein Pint_29910 [Pistacia integerrima]|uniref:Uncharacterized protein n=1 Tax=Pistacia integerrima TaxID=434235 RepID=A0ACC0X056_9ROSI|nr:hypothetical protein Pint_29910 [Pistacia integerrima]